MPCIRAFFTEDDGVTPIEVTLPATTEPPATQVPTTQVPTTQAPTSQAPTTQAPPTQAPTTQAPTTQAPTTQAPTTQAPTTQVPTTQAPTTPNPTTPAASSGRYDYGDALSKSLLFYMAQRSGTLPDDVIPWRKDSAENDGLQVSDGWKDLSGGWYDGE